jgi:hypothetical protein
MRKLITAVAVAALLASAAAPPALARGGHRDHGIWHSPAYHTGSYFKHRPYYGSRHRYWRQWPGYRYRHWPPGHRRYRHHGHGGYYYFHGDGAVVLGVLAGALVLGALLSRPAPAPARPPVLRSPAGAPLGGCLRTTGTGAWNGRPARFTGTMCYDPAGRAYVLPGSARFVGYLR